MKFGSVEEFSGSDLHVRITPVTVAEVKKLLALPLEDGGDWGYIDRNADRRSFSCKALHTS